MINRQTEMTDSYVLSFLSPTCTASPDDGSDDDDDDDDDAK
jgi:hypothetical protein